MTEKFAPAPWVIEESWDDFIVKDANGADIIFQDGPYGTPTILESNVHLIAAAPELYKALKDLVGLYYGIDNQGRAGDYAENALKILEKARGE